jgi:hypothetical protein
MKKLVAVMLAVLLSTSAWAQGLSLPAGTGMKVKLENNVSTSTSKTGDPFTGRVTEAVMLDGKPVIPIGATVEGRVTRAVGPRRISGKPTIVLFPEALIMPNGDRYVLNAALVDTNQRKGTDVNSEGEFKGNGIDGKDWTKIGMGTGGGMLVGGLIGGGKGLLIGGLVGATATVTYWLGKHRSAELPAGSELTMELSRPMEMTAAAAGQ